MPFIQTKDSFIKKAYLASLILGLLSFAILGVLWNRLSPEVPLFYSLPWGENQIVPRIFLFLLPLAILLFNALGIIFTKILTQDSLALKMLWGGITTSAILETIAITRIIFLIW